MFANRGLPFVCFAVILIKIRATLHLCDNHNGYLEIEEGKNNIFTEPGVSQELKVQWKQTFPISNNPNDIGECPGGSTVCTSQLDQIFTFSRTVNTVSVIVNEPAANNKQIFWTMNLLLLTFSGSTKLDENSCPLDLINPPVGASCTVQFSGTPWRVTGLCNVTQVLSKRGRYYCRVYQVQEPSSPRSLVGNFTMTTSRNGNTEYFDGYCEINFTLPPVGKYNYDVVVVPGERQVSAFFNGSNEIKLPRSPFHNCSQNVIEGQTLRCSCSAREPGFPPGFPVWKGTASSELLLSNVNRTYNERVYSCTVMWNNTAIEQENYTLTVNYPPSVLTFQIDSKESQTLNVTENSKVLVICRADGKPLPTISLLKQSNDNQPEEVAVAKNSGELKYNLSVTSCETAGDYLCTSNNNIGFSHKESLINVLCAPRMRTNDSYLTTFKDQEARLLFEMMAYPPPDALSIFHKTNSLNVTIYRNIEHKNVAQFSCVSEKLYMVFCTLTLHNQTVFHTGFYEATFKNIQGNVTFMFEIKEETDLSTPPIEVAGQSKPDVAGPVAGGVIGAVFVIALAVSAVIFIIRRKRKRFERGTRANPVMTDPQRSSETLYDQLQRGDVNKPSVYQTLGPRQTSKDFKNHEEQGKSHVYEFPIDLHEHTRGTHQKETIYQNTTLS